jgi:hypothetical protein
MYLLRESVTFGDKPKAAPNEIWRIKNISTPKIAEESGYVTPNVNVVYGFGFMDLGREPVIFTVPDSNDRYHMVEIVDMWTNAFAYGCPLPRAFYMVLRNYAPVPEVAKGLQDLQTFVGPPGAVPVT